MLKPSLAKLSIAEKILLVEDLWDSIAASRKGPPVTDEERTYVKVRMASLRKRTYKTKHWTVLKKELGI